jgi:hypothetical protein
MLKLLKNNSVGRLIKNYARKNGKNPILKLLKPNEGNYYKDL